MTLDNLQKAMDEAARFIEKAVRAKHSIEPHVNKNQYLSTNEETETVILSSMDLSRALSELRK